MHRVFSRFYRTCSCFGIADTRVIDTFTVTVSVAVVAVVAVVVVAAAAVDVVVAVVQMNAY